MGLLRSDWLMSGGEMGKWIGAMDWSSTPVGPMESWPQSLKTAVSILLNSRYPMFVWWGRQLTNIYNDAYIPMLGARHPQALGQSAPRVWADVWPVVGPQAEAVMREGRATWNESILLVMERHGYAEEAYFTFSYSPAPDDAGEVGGVFCAVTEDTARVLGERRLKTLRDLGERTLAAARTVEQSCHAAAVTLADNLHDFPFALIYLLDEDGKVARLCETVNLPAGSNSSPSTVTVGSGDDVWNFSRVIQGGQSQISGDLEERFGRLPAGPWADDWTKRALTLPLPKAGPQELPAGFLVAGISPRLTFDDDYRSFLDLAARQIANAISNARAYQEERKRAEALVEIDRAKTAFFSNVSHEFRTPLTLMLGPLEDALAEDGLSPVARERLMLARRNSLRLLKLVNMLLDFSRIEAGRTQAAYEPVDLAELTTDLASVFRAAIERAGLKLMVDCPPLGQPVYVDCELWEKIVLNLISNAFKFTFEGEIGVSLKRVGEAVELAVRDTGVGIRTEELPRVFDRFHRAKGVRGRSYEGSGIGLALVRELAVLHGGTARVESEVGRGSVFTVSIPLGKAHLPADHIAAARPHASPGSRGEAYVEEALRWLPESQAEVAEGETRDDGRTDGRDAAESMRRSALGAPRSRILFADDNADMREYVRHLLSERYDVVAVADGAEALKAARESPFDLVLTDVMMPNLDGFGLLRELRADERLRIIPAVLISARAGEEARIEGIDAGADEYIVKPFAAKELIARIGGRLEMARIRREAELSERKLRSEAQQAKERLEGVLAGISDQLLALDHDWRYVFVNDRVLEVTGLGKEELLGRRIWELFPELIGTEFEREARRAMAEKTPAHIEFFHSPRSQWFESRIYPTASGLTIFVADVTKRKRAEEALRESEERFRGTFENAAVGIAHVDADGSWLRVNQRFCEITGYTQTELLERTFQDITHPDDLEADLKFARQALAGEINTYSMEKRYIRKNGSAVWVHLTVSHSGGAPGRPNYFIAAVEDISARKQAEEAMSRLAAIVESSADAIVSKDLNGVIRSWNKGAERLFGYPAEEIIGQSIMTLIPHDRADEEARVLESIRRGETIDHYETIRRRKDGSLVEVSLTVSPVRDKNGRIIGASKIARDVTERKRVQEEIARLLTEEQAAREVAEQATHAKDEFMALVSHELRSPLNAILGWNRLLRSQRGDDPQIMKIADTVERNGKAQLQLIDDLLDTARIISGKMKLIFEPVEPVAVISSALDTIRPAADSKGVAVITDLDPNAGQITGDPDRLQQVVWNLVSNAIKFTPSGGHIRVELRRSGAGVEIAVSDTGRGIGADLLPYVFDRFKQGDSDASRRHGGLGLGLSLTKHLVELHGGSVTAESPGADQGATFIVNLPMRAVKGSGAERREGEETAGLLPSPRTRTRKLEGVRALVVDDDAGARELLTATLEQYGVLVTGTDSLIAALSELESRLGDPASEPFDIVISDVGMPGGDGYELIQRLRAHTDARVSRIRAIALTAYARSEDRLRALRAGFQMHVPKPVDEEELTTVISALTDRI